MPMPDIELLTTDIMFFLLLLGTAGYALYVCCRPHLWEPWLRLLRNRRGVAAAVVLAAFTMVAVLDSVHLRPAVGGELLSLFDLLVEPLRNNVERSYSQPFARVLFAREFVVNKAGQMEFIQPALAYGGTHLYASQSLWQDVAVRSGWGLVLALGCSLPLFLLCCGVVGRNCVVRGWKAILGRHTACPWDVIFIVGTMLLALIAVLCMLAPHYHVLGTDKVGQDVLYQALKSIRTGLLIGTLSTLFMLPLALLAGISAGYFRGVVDDVVQYLYSTLSSVPGVLLIAAALLIAQAYMNANAESFTSLEQRADLRLLLLCLILGLTSWTSLCRLLRAETLKLSGIEFVQAAHALGVGHGGILLRHILPNVMHIVLIVLALDFSALVLAEAVLSYVNIGVDPATHSWGNMINGARLELARDPPVWWSLLAAFIFMPALVLAANLFADAVNEAFDPRAGGSAVPATPVTGVM
ncbi:MAG: ABC transporter permease [Candidatus Porifericomitaceae bacterium WSBS_2022_MAG_OTU9]